jgi:hypothetical protein
MCESQPQLFINVLIRIKILTGRPNVTERMVQLMLPVSSRTTGIEQAVVDQDEKAEKRDEDGVKDGRDLGQVQQAAAVHAHQQQGLRP